MKVFFFIVIVFLIFATSCSKAPEYPIEPVIQFKSMTKTRMLSALCNIYRDSFSLLINFTDGDGDIGSPNDSRPVDAFLINIEKLDTVPFTLPYIAPKGATKGVNGEMKFLIFTSECTVPDKRDCKDLSVKYPLDTLHYKLIIKDRAGNKSNELILPPIELICNQ